MFGLLLALLFAPTPQVSGKAVEGSILEAPPPASLSKADVAAWTSRYVRADDWTVLAHDLEGVKLAHTARVRQDSEGYAETEVRTELFHPVEISVGAARSGMARWTVDCAQGRFAVREMSVYAGNNLQGEIAHKTTGGGLIWQGPIGSEGATLQAICRAIGREAVLAEAP